MLSDILIDQVDKFVGLRDTQVFDSDSDRNSIKKFLDDIDKLIFVLSEVDGV
jgi:hypothetical protein